MYNADSAYACTISGVPENNIEDIQLNNITLYYKGGSMADTNTVVPENENAYPEPGMFGRAISNGFLIRHVSGLQLNNITINHLLTDKRPAFVFDDADHILMNRIYIDTENKQPWAVLNNVKQFYVWDSEGIKDEYIDAAAKRILIK